MKTLLVVLLVVAIAAAAWIYRSKIPGLHTEPKFDGGPVRVVRQRPGTTRRAPGAKLSEPEAVMTLRQHLAPRVEKSECLAIAGRGFRAGAYEFDAVDSCARTKLGHFRVDANSAEVRQ